MDLLTRVMKEVGGCPKCAESVLRRLDLCQSCTSEYAVDGCAFYTSVMNAALESGVSVMVTMCKGYSIL